MITSTTPNGRRESAGRSVVLDQPVGSTRTVEKPAPGSVGAGLVRRTVLPSGLRIVTEQLSGSRSVAFGVWVAVGSMDEQPALHGCSHFLEHLLFKGTRERSSAEISGILDSLGGDANAYTAKEYTCYHARVLDEDLPELVDVVGDMLTASVITDADVDAERGVILDELAMHDDDPDDALGNLMSLKAWGSGPLGRAIGGSESTVAALTPEQVRRFYRRHYTPQSMVITAVGNLEHTEVVRLVKRAFAREGFLDSPGEPRQVGAGGKTRRMQAGAHHETRPIEQVNLVLAVDGVPRRDPRRFVLSVLNTALGGGASSRLFQEVRERRGLAYSVYSFASHHPQAGLVGVGAGCLPDRTDDVVATVRSELQRLRTDPITADELSRAQRQLRRGVVLGMEDPGARMDRLGKAELLYGELRDVSSVLAEIDAVSVEDVASLSEDLFASRELLVSVGPGSGPH